MSVSGAPRAGWSRPPDIYIALFLAAITLAAFWPAQDRSFLSYDDPGYVTDNPHVRDGLTVEGVAWAFGTGAQGNWHPLTWLSHMLDATLFGLNARGHLLTSLLIHLASVLLLFRFLRLSTGAPFLGGFVAGLFAVHPLRVESVAWVAERKDVLSTLFLMLALLAWLRYARRPGVARYLPVVLLFALGLMAKPMLVTLPFLLLLLDFWPLDRVPARWAARRTRTPAFPRLERATWSLLILEKLPLLALALISSVVTFLVQQGGQAVKSVEQFPLGERLANAALAYVVYVRRAFWPDDLAFFYPYPESFPAWKVLLAVAALALVSLLALRYARRAPYLFTGWFGFAGMLVPVIGLIQVGGQAMADRYTYVPLVGLGIVVAWGADDLTSGRRWRGAVLAPLAVVILVALTLVTRSLVGHWADSSSLYRRALTVTRNNHVAHDLLGVELFRQGRNDEALRHYSEALRIAPTHASARNNLGVALAAQGRFDEAIPHYRAALEANERFGEAHNNLGIALASLRRIDEALEQFESALRVRPDDPEVHQNLGIAWSVKGEPARAVGHYREAARLEPGWHAVAIEAAWILATHPDPAVRDGTEALRLARQAGEALGRPEPRQLDVLAAALAETGSYQEAVRAARRAAELAIDRGDGQFATSVNGRIELYRAGRPYHTR